MSSISNKDAEQIRKLLADYGQDAAHIASVLNGLTPELIELLRDTQQKLSKTRAENKKLTSALDQAQKKIDEYKAEFDYAQHRLTDAIETLMALATLDFNKQANISDNADEYDGLAMGLNMLGQELKFSTVSINFLEDIFQSISEVLIVVDECGVIESCNPAAREIFGRDLVKSNILSLITQSAVPTDLFEEGHLKSLIAEERVEVAELSVVKGDQKYIPLEVFLYPMKSRKGVVIVARDITERREAEVRQQQLVTNLEKSNAELRQFAYVASHDLKAPLRAISMLAQWVMDDSGDSLTEDSKANLEMLITRAQRMYSFLDSMLAYSRIGVNEEQLSEIDLNKLVKEVIANIVVPEHVEIMLNNMLPTVRAAEIHMIQVFQNLISNAVKYMDKPEGRIEVGYVQDTSEHHFYVKDNGPGIDKQYYERIFVIFQTLNARDTSESTGIGLTIVKKILDSYNGKIWLESEPGQGTSFYFTLPPH